MVETVVRREAQAVMLYRSAATLDSQFLLWTRVQRPSESSWPLPPSGTLAPQIPLVTRVSDAASHGAAQTAAPTN